MNVPAVVGSWTWLSSLVTDNSALAGDCWHCEWHLPCFISPPMLSLLWLKGLWQSSQLYETSVSCVSRLCWSSFCRRVKCFLHGTHTTGLLGALLRVAFFLRVVVLVPVLRDKTLFGPSAALLLSALVGMVIASVFATSGCSWSSADINSSDINSNTRSINIFTVLLLPYTNSRNKRTWIENTECRRVVLSVKIMYS